MNTTKKTITASILSLSVTVALLPSCSSFVAPLRHHHPQLLQQVAMATDNDSASERERNNDNVTNVSSSGHMFDRRKIFVGVGGILSSSFIQYNNIDGINYRAVAAEESPTKKEFPNMVLPNNVKMPVLALNTAGMSTDDTARACEIAASNGFRHFDFHPGKERDGVAKFLGGKRFPRSEFFLTTKIRKPPIGTTPVEAEELAKRQIDEDLATFGSNAYFDMLMLRDSPDCEVMAAQWKVLEQALKDGKCRSVGVINFCEESLRCLLKSSKTKPAVNYYYYHVGMNTGRGYKLREFCDRKKIKTFAYGALGEPGPYLDDRILTSPILKNIGDSSKIYNKRNHGEGDKSPEEIAIKWVIEDGAAGTY